jgi:hypothetical protein
MGQRGREAWDAQEKDGRTSFTLRGTKPDTSQLTMMMMMMMMMINCNDVGTSS